MKTLTAIACLLLATCSTLPVKGRVCYKGVCVDSDGESLTLTGYIK